MKTSTFQLPIDNYIEEIVESVDNNAVTVISAETGSGKSTRVPLILYQAGYNKVICTQPRRLACISLANHVKSLYSSMSAQSDSCYYEDSEASDDLIGYHTAFETNKTDNTRILYCTDGLALAKLNTLFNDIDSTSVLIIDEVHEWNINIETLIAYANKMLTDSNSVKLVIMSATIDTSIFINFFNSTVNVINVPSRQYEVKKDFNCKQDYHVLIASMINKGKNVLAFQSGKKEIDETINKVKHLIKIEAKLLPLYSDLSCDKQQDCFKTYNVPKLIVATNIAQTSLTISDIDVVVDNGQEKQYKVVDGIECLAVTEISKADCLQRAGRAGRTKDGQYFLCSKYSYESRLDYPVPEIQRLTLDRVVLKLFSVGIDLSNLTMIHNPSTAAIKQAKLLLLRLGTINNKNQLTSLGEKVLNIPVSVRYACMIAEASNYNKQVVEDVITISAILEYGGILKTAAKSISHNYVNYGVIRRSYSTFSNESNSDPVAELEIYKKRCQNKLSFEDDQQILKGHFNKIKVYLSKLLSLIQYNGNSEKPYFIDDVRRCIVLGMLDTVYKPSSGEYNTVIDEHGRVFKLSNYSVNYNSYLSDYLFVGIPKTVTYRNKYNITITSNILTFSTSFKFNDIKKYLSQFDSSKQYLDFLQTYIK